MTSLARNLVLFFFTLIFFGVLSSVHAASLGGYGADVTPDGSLGSGASTALDIVDKTNTLSAGTVRRADVYFDGNFLSKSIRFKVWRQNGTNFDLVGESGSYAISSSTSQGRAKNTLVLTTPITAQAGDYIGVGLGSGFFSVGMKTGSFSSKYKTGDITSGSVAESGFSSYSAALSIKYYDDDYLTSITPSTSYNDQSQSVTIVGRGFQSGATVTLTKSGQTTITATNVVVGSATSITADINLSGKQTGLWTVVVTNPDTSYSSFVNGFSVYNHSAVFLGIGDSISGGSNRYIGPEAGGPSGNFLSQMYPYISDLTTGTSFYNAGIGSTVSSNTDSRIGALLTSKTPSKVYVQVGINDIAGGSVTLSSYMANLSSILTKVTNASAELIVNQILPYPASAGAYTETVKLWNASIEKFGYDNNVKIAPTFQELSSTTTDDGFNINYDGGDATHPSIGGYTRMGTLMANAAVPTKKRVWGSTSFPGFSYESLKWFLFSGGGSVTGDSDTGSLSIPQNATASSDVIAIESGSKPVALTANVSAGTASMSYRTSPTNFTRANSSISWTSYTAPFTVSSDQFIQVRLTGTSASAATVTDMTMSWRPTTFTLTGPSSGSVNSASTNFTVTPDNLYTGTVTVTPSGGGLSTPTVLTFSNSATAQTFTVTPTTGGTVTLTPTNNGSLTNPSALTYTANPIVPGAPTSVTATAGNAQATVSFTAPASTGGATITSYTVTSTPGNITATGSASPITVTGLTNGTAYTFAVTATNSAGTGSASSASNSVTPVAPDTTAPSVSITAPTTGSTVSGASVSIAANASDNVAVAGVQFKLDGSNLQSEDTSSPYSITWDSTGTADGSHTLTAIARDTSSNTTTSSSVTVTVDNTAPMRSSGSPSGTLALNTTSTTISLTTNEAATCKYSTSSGTAYGSMTAFSTTGGTTHSATVSGLSNASSYTYYVKCADGQSNTNATDYAISFAVAADATAPTVSITAPLTNTTVSGASVAIAATATDDVAVIGVQFKLDGSNLQSEDTTSPYGITWDTTGAVDGTHTLTAVARDGSSNSATSTSVVVTVDNTAPVRSAGSPSTALTAGTTSTTMSLTTDEAATCKYSTTAATLYGSMTSFGTTGSTAHSTTINSLSNGTSYTYYVKCADAQGTTNATDYSISFSVATPVNVAPTANAGADQSITLPISTATLSGTDSTDSDGTIATYAWSQTGGPTTATITSSSAATTTISGLSQTGTYVFTLTVTDNSAATASDDVSITVASGGPRLTGSIGPRHTPIPPPLESVPVCKTDCLPATSLPQTTIPATITPITSIPVKPLKWKTTSSEVMILQHYLNTHGFPVAPSGVGSLNHETLYFGLATKAALIKFQKANKLIADGIAGKKTWTLMMNSK